MKNLDIWCDFNAVADGKVRTLLSHVRSGITISGVSSLMVVAGDDEGTRALARVVSVEGEVVTLVIVKYLGAEGSRDG